MIKTDDANFYTDIVTNDKMCVVKFWAEWCGPCHAFSPTLQSVVDGMQDIMLYSLNIDENPESTKNYMIKSIPTSLIFKGGQVVGKIVGNVDRRTVVEILEEATKI